MQCEVAQNNSAPRDRAQAAAVTLCQTRMVCCMYEPDPFPNQR